MQSHPPIEPGNKSADQKIWILWLAILAATGIYLLVGLIVSQTQTPTMDEQTRTFLTLALAVVAVTISFVILVIVPRVFPKTMPYFTYSVLRYALCESIAIFGLVLMIMGATLAVAGVFIGWTAVLLFFNRPTKSDEQKYLRLKGGAGPHGKIG